MKSVMIDNWVIEDIATLGKNMIYSSGLHRLTRAHSPLSCAMDK